MHFINIYLSGIEVVHKSCSLSTLRLMFFSLGASALHVAASKGYLQVIRYVGWPLRQEFQ